MPSFHNNLSQSFRQTAIISMSKELYQRIIKLAPATIWHHTTGGSMNCSLEPLYPNAKLPANGSAVNVPIRCCGTVINPDDIRFADYGSVLVLPKNTIAEMLKKAEQDMAGTIRFCTLSSSAHSWPHCPRPAPSGPDPRSGSSPFLPSSLSSIIFWITAGLSGMICIASRKKHSCIHSKSVMS